MSCIYIHKDKIILNNKIELMTLLHKKRELFSSPPLLILPLKNKIGIVHSKYK